jgi:hypothetical protein
MIKRLKKFIPEESDNSSEDSEIKNSSPKVKNIQISQAEEKFNEEEEISDNRKNKLKQKKIEVKEVEYKYFKIGQF